MAFGEKTAWSTLVATVLVYGFYFARFLNAVASGRAWAPIISLSLAVIAYVILQIILTAIAAATSPKEALMRQDEREHKIQSRARGGALYVAQLAGIGAVASVYFADKWLVANAMLAALILAELARNVLVISGYRQVT